MIRFAILLILAGGCARFSTTQTDISYEQNIPVRTIKTRVSAFTLFSASAELSKFSATQTDKTQSAKVGALEQQSTGTNLINAVGAGIGTALKIYTGQ